MTDEELKQLVEGNARAIEALTDDASETRRTMAENDRRFRAGLEEFSQKVQAFADWVVESTRQAQAEREELRRVSLGIANLLASLDEDRPTVLRNLTRSKPKSIARWSGTRAIGTSSLSIIKLLIDG